MSAGEEAGFHLADILDNRIAVKRLSRRGGVKGSNCYFRTKVSLAE